MSCQSETNQMSGLWGGKPLSTAWLDQMSGLWGGKQSASTDTAERHGLLSGLYRFTAVAVLIFMITAAAFASNGTDNSSKLSGDLTGLKPGTKVTVIIQWVQKADDSDLDKVKQAGGNPTHHKFVNMTVVRDMPVSALNGLVNNSHIKYITVDRPVQKTLDHVSRAVNADVAWSYGYDGTGVGIAIVDSGVYAQHQDLLTATGGTRVVYGESFVAGDSNPDDLYGHGTHVAGIAAGDGSASLTGYPGDYKGIAPNANVINLRVLDGTGGGTDAGVIAAINRAIQLKSQYNIRVLNLSLGRSVFESYALDPLCQAVEQAWKAGIFVAVAAGNSGRDNSMHTQGYGTITAPGNDPLVITVGAMNMKNTFSRTDDAIASYSSKGPTLFDHVVKPDLVAPGDKVVSLATPNGYLEQTYPRFSVLCDGSAGECMSAVQGSKYFRLNGTSMATPVVSGAAALMLQKDPTLTPDQIKARMMKTAYKSFAMYASAFDPLGHGFNMQADMLTYGAGYLDVAAALNSTDKPSGLAVSPSIAYDTASGRVLLIMANSTIWGGNIIWGSNILWGSNIIWGAGLMSGSNILWGSNIVWGASTDAGFNIIWGSNIIWGASAMSALSDEDPGDCDVDPVTGAPVCPVL